MNDCESFEKLTGTPRSPRAPAVPSCPGAPASPWKKNLTFQKICQNKMYPIKSKCQINKNEGNCELTLSPGGPLGPGGPSSPCRENALVNMAVFWINNTTSTSSVYFWVRLITSPWVQACQENHLLHARPWAPLETQDYNLDVILAKLVPAKSIFQAYHQPRGTNEPTVYQPKHIF